MALNETAITAAASSGTVIKILAALITGFDWITKMLVKLIDNTPLNPAQARIVLVLAYAIIAYVLLSVVKDVAQTSKKVMMFGTAILLIFLVISAIFKAT